MSDFNDLIDRYIDVWNETDAGKRRALITRIFTEGTHFIDPLQEGDGQAGIDALVAGVHERFPGYRFRRAGTVDAHHDYVRFRWELAPEGGEVFVDGTDFASVVDGRLHRVTGFFDRTPAVPVEPSRFPRPVNSAISASSSADLLMPCDEADFTPR